MELGIIGLGVMGAALAENALAKGIDVIAFNQNVKSEIQGLEERFNAHGLKLFTELSEFCKAFKGPKYILMLLPAGDLIDDFIAQLRPYMSSEDVLMDGGNSFYKDTNRRYKALEHQGLSYLGIGVSGGEQGALKGPAMMIGGDVFGFERVKPILERLGSLQGSSYRFDDLKKGDSCIRFLGKGGAGHFVKMIHNGLEYGQMQLIVESYLLSGEQGDVFNYFSDQGADSFLVQTAIKVLARRDEKGELLLNHIDELATGKGTGAWTVQTAGEFGIPAPITAESLFARSLSEAKKHLKLNGDAPSKPSKITKEELLQVFKWASFINHFQCFFMLDQAESILGAPIDLTAVLIAWSNGSIVESEILPQAYSELKNQGGLRSLWPKEAVFQTEQGQLASLIAMGMQAGIYHPSYAAAWNFAQGLGGEKTGANFIQALRDVFGAHGVFIQGTFNKMSW